MIAAEATPTEATEGTMKSRRAGQPEGAGLARVLVYYALLAAGAWVLVRNVPGVTQFLSSGAGLGAGWANPFSEGTAAEGTPVGQTPWAGGVLGAASMLAALAMMVPVTWVYVLTRRWRGYDESILHALLLLPVAVTGIVMIVRDSLALAFSLAGIVAAVRFRTTLEDTKDAVYVFLAIGVGIACGVQAVGLALVLSLVFNAVVLVLWSTRFGNPYAAALTGDGSLALGTVLARPDSSEASRLVGDPAILDAAAPRDVAHALEQASRLERHLEEERLLKKGERANTLLLVTARQVEGAQRQVETILEEATSRWKLVEVVEAPGGGWVLQYLIRLDDGTAEGALLDRIRGEGNVVIALELRSLKGRK